MSQEPFWQTTEDWHTAGEPFRIVSTLPAGHLSDDKTLTVAAQRQQILETPNHPLDLLRQTLCHEPRGHADMYGGFIVPPDDDGAHFGVLFWHKDGFSTACGHGTIALGYWALAHGIVESGSEKSVDVVIDVPSGRVVARAALDGAGKVLGVDFVNVASYQLSAGQDIEVQVSGKSVPVTVDLAFGGAVYACVNATRLGLSVESANYQTFVALGRQVKLQFPGFLYNNKYDIYGVCFFEERDDTPQAITQRNVVVFADGQIDRSPCGSGTCARIAVLLAQGKVAGEKRLIHESIIGTQFEAFVTASAAGEGDFPGCIPCVRGEARLVGKMEFFIDPSDPVYPGFVFR